MTAGCAPRRGWRPADDAGRASSQNEPDHRHYAVAAGVPLLELADSQEAYGSTLAAVEISERWASRYCCG